MLDEIVVAIEPGLGDHFICNGLINYLSQFYARVYLPVYNVDVHNNWVTVQALYSHKPKIKLVRIDRFVRHWEPYTTWSHLFSTWGLPTLQIAHADVGNPAHWYRSFYHQLLIPWETWKTHASLPPVTDTAEQLFEEQAAHLGEYMLVHDLSTAGHSPVTKIPHSDLPVVRIVPGVSSNLLDWRLVIERASQLHLIGSSVFCLANILGSGVTGQKFYHHCRPLAPPLDPQDFADWTFVDYGI